MSRKILTLFVLAALVVLFSVPTSYAMMRQKHPAGSMQYGIKGSFFMSVQRILEKRDELGLSDEQVKKIKNLTAEVQKEMIKQDAEIKTLKVEINTLMWEAPLDTETANNLLAEKYKLAKDKAKYLVSAHDRLNKILTEEQLKKVRPVMCR